MDIFISKPKDTPVAKKPTIKDKKKFFPRLSVVLVTFINYPWRISGKVSVAVLISTNTR